MKSIQRRISTHETIDKSLFINYLIPVRTIDQAMEKYQEVKKEHADATHHCFAYIIGRNKEHQKYVDDGEPSRTAGFPMLDVLLKHDVTDILAVTVRYYGGIKLGAGGLVRAYSGSVANSMKQAKFAFLQRFLLFRLEVGFNDIGQVEHFLHKDYDLVHTEYHTNVIYFVEINESDKKSFQTFIKDKTSGRATIQIIQTIERYI